VIAQILNPITGKVLKKYILILKLSLLMQNEIWGMALQEG
jgi:hypothetical protein